MKTTFHKTVGLFTLVAGFFLLSPTGARAVEPVERQLNTRTQQFNYRRSLQAAEQLMELAQQSAAAADYDTAIAAWQEASVIYSTLGNTQVVKEISQSLAETYVALERYDEAATAFRQLVAIAAENNDVAGQIYGLNNLGTAYIQEGEVSRAQAAFVEALTLAREARDPAGMGLSSSNLGLAAWRLGDLESAREYYEAATGYRLQGDDDAGLAHSSNSLGRVYQELGEERNALGAFLVARRTAIELQQTSALLTALDGLIEIYSDRGDTAQVQTYIAERLASTEDDAPLTQQLGLYVSLGRYFEQIEDGRQAKAAYNQALTLAQQVGDKRQEVYLLNRLQDLAYF